MDNGIGGDESPQRRIVVPCVVEIESALAVEALPGELLWNVDIAFVAAEGAIRCILCQFYEFAVGVGDDV